MTFSLITDHACGLICPVCGGAVFSKLSNSDSFICITCYRKHYVDNYGWYDLDYYYILDDMIEREKVRRLLQDSGNFDATKKLLDDHKKKNKTNKKHSNIGEVLLNMDMATVNNMNDLLGKLNQEDLLYNTKEDAIKYVKAESKRYNFDLVLENDDDKKNEYNTYINWKDNRILSGFIETYENSKDKWWMGFGYFYIENN